MQNEVDDYCPDAFSVCRSHESTNYSANFADQ